MNEIPKYFRTMGAAASLSSFDGIACRTMSRQRNDGNRTWRLRGKNYREKSEKNSSRSMNIFKKPQSCGLVGATEGVHVRRHICEFFLHSGTAFL